MGIKAYPSTHVAGQMRFQAKRVSPGPNADAVSRLPAIIRFLMKRFIKFSSRKSNLILVKEIIIPNTYNIDSHCDYTKV